MAIRPDNLVSVKPDRIGLNRADVFRNIRRKNHTFTRFLADTFCTGAIAAQILKSVSCHFLIAPCNLQFPIIGQFEIDGGDIRGFDFKAPVNLKDFG